MSLDYFPAGVPPGSLFKMSIEDMEEIVKDFDDKGPLNSAAELCIIGLASYFEAYCKNQFASIINICPHLLANFVEKRSELSIPINDLLDFDFNVKSNIGFILSEKYDFGSAKKVNGLFQDLLKCTPFSSTDKKLYDKFLADRNLLVHHGGTFTHNYGKQYFKRKIDNKSRIFFDSLVVKKANYLEYAKFIDAMAKKINDKTHSLLCKTIRENGWILDEVASQALNMLDYYEN